MTYFMLYCINFKGITDRTTDEIKALSTLDFRDCSEAASLKQFLYSIGKIKKEDKVLKKVLTKTNSDIPSNIMMSLLSSYLSEASRSLEHRISYH